LRYRRLHSGIRNANTVFPNKCADVPAIKNDIDGTSNHPDINGLLKVPSKYVSPNGAEEASSLDNTGVSDQLKPPVIGTQIV
jgi:hypothetical protein